MGWIGPRGVLWQHAMTLGVHWALSPLIWGDFSIFMENVHPTKLGSPATNKLPNREWLSKSPIPNNFWSREAIFKNSIDLTSPWQCLSISGVTPAERGKKMTTLCANLAKCGVTKWVAAMVVLKSGCNSQSHPKKCDSTTDSTLDFLAA